MGLSRYWAGALSEASVGRTALPGIASVHLALLTSSALPSETGAQVLAREAGYPGYARTALLPTVFGPWDGSLRNVAAIALPVATAGAATVIAWSLLDAAVGGNQLWLGEMVPLLLTPADSAPQIGVGLLELVLAT